MAFTAYVNETLRVTAQDLFHSDSGAVTSGATVTVAVYDAAGVLQSTASITTPPTPGDDWWIDITAPATAGVYSIRVTAVKSGATWESVETLTVLSLAIASVTGYTTKATLVRKVDRQQPTLLLDELDAALKTDVEYVEALRGVLNGGYLRSGTYSMCVGQGANLTDKDFHTFGAKILAGIGTLPRTVASRSI